MKKTLLIVGLIVLMLTTFVGCKYEYVQHPEFYAVDLDDVVMEGVLYKFDTSSNEWVSNETPDSATVGTFKRDLHTGPSSQWQTGLTVSNTGEVKGTLIYVDMTSTCIWPEGQREGYYGLFMKNNEPLLLYLGNDAETIKGAKKPVKKVDSNDTLIELDFANVTFVEKTNPVKKVSGTPTNDTWVSGAKKSTTPQP